MDDQLQNPALSDAVKVTPPRAFWFDFLLLLGSFNIYSPFWLVAQVRDLKKLSNADVKPWAWFFVPWVLIAQFWALPRLGKHLDRYEDQVGLDRRSGSYGWWIAAVIVLTALNNASYRFENLANWVLASLIVLYAFAFSLLALRIRRVKSHDPKIQAATHLKRYRWWEWVIVIVGTPISCSLLWIFVSESMVEGAIRSYDSGTQFEDEEYGFVLPIKHVDWIHIDTPENEDDLYTFTGPNNEMAVYIYQYEGGMTLNELMTYRYKEAMSVIPTLDCEERQSFIAGTLNIKAVQTCISTDVLGVDAYITALIKEGDRIIEMHTQVYTSQAETGSIVRSAIAAAEGFDLL